MVLRLERLGIGERAATTAPARCLTLVRYLVAERALPGVAMATALSLLGVEALSLLGVVLLAFERDPLDGVRLARLAGVPTRRPGVRLTRLPGVRFGVADRLASA